MMSRAVSFLILVLLVGGAPAQRQGAGLPDALNEDEVQLILREQKPKSHVEATFKVSDVRLTTALNLARDSQYRESAQNLDLYVGLVQYADTYARRATQQGSKDRGSVLKVIEQRIFRQMQSLDSVVKELPFDYREQGDKAIREVKLIRTRALDDHLGGGGFLKSATSTP